MIPLKIIFKDEKNDESKIKINFSENYFVPMNSLLFEAQTKINEDFFPILIFELFSFLEYSLKEFSNFFEFIKRKIESLVSTNNIDLNEIEKNAKKIKDNDDEMQIMSNSIEKIKNLFSILNLKKESYFNLELKLKIIKQKKS